MNVVSCPRLAIVAPGELYGGVERHVTGLCSELLELGLPEPKVVLFHDREQAAQVRALGLEPHFLDGRGKYDPRLAGELRSVLIRAGAEVVHLHGYRATITAWCMADRRDFAFVKTEHGRPEPPQGAMIGRLKTTLNHRLDDLATRGLGAVICYVTADLKSYFDCAHRGLRRKVVYNGIPSFDPSDLPRPSSLPVGGIHLGIVGRISRVKGIDTAVRAMAHPDMPAEAVLHIIGTGPLQTELAVLAEREDVAERVVFHGFCDDVYGLLAHLDVLLMPSLHEGLPYTLLEAMTLRTPVVASDVGGLGEVIRDGETGLLFPCGNVEALARHCRSMSDSKELGLRLATHAAADQEARFTLRRMTEQYLENYREAAAGNCGVEESESV